MNKLTLNKVYMILKNKPLEEGKEILPFLRGTQSLLGYKKADIK